MDQHCRLADRARVRRTLGQAECGLVEDDQTGSASLTQRWMAACRMEQVTRGRASGGTIWRELGHVQGEPREVEHRRDRLLGTPFNPRTATV
jgi:hypothetical protein